MNKTAAMSVIIFMPGLDEVDNNWQHWQGFSDVFLLHFYCLKSEFLEDCGFLPCE